MNVTLLIVLVIILIVARLVLVWHNNRQQNVMEGSQTPIAEMSGADPQQIEKALDVALDTLNVTRQMDDELQSSDIKAYRFVYQSKQFLLRIFRKFSSRVEIAYPYVFTVKSADIDRVRQICNELTRGNIMVSAYYEPDAKNDEIDVWLKSSFFATTDAMLNALIIRQTIDVLFAVQHDIHNAYDDLVKHAEMTDVEYAQLYTSRLNCLTAEDEMRHPLDGTLTADAPTTPDRESLTLGHWLSLTYALPKGSELLHLSASADDGYAKIVTGNENVRNYCILEPIAHPMTPSDNGKERKTAKTASVIVYYQRPFADGEEENLHTLCIAMETISESDGVVYVRVSFVANEKEMQYEPEYAVKRAAYVKSGTTVMAVDWKTGKSRHSEFEYMWREAQDKVQEGREDELTQEQRIVRHITNSDAGFDLYWGMQMVRTGRFVEALPYLLRVWGKFNDDYSQLNANSLETYRELCYLVGLCYMKLRNPVTAAYYLTLIETHTTPRYAKEYINALIAAKDRNILNFVEQTIVQFATFIDGQRERGEEVPDEHIDYYNFLQRRRVHILVERRYYKEAERVCNELLENEDLNDFAENELKYINSTRDFNHDEGRDFDPANH